MGKVMFLVCLSVQTWGRGVTPSPSHNTSTSPMSFPGVTPVTGPSSLGGGGGTPVPGGRGGYFSPRWGATPVPGGMEYSSPRWGGGLPQSPVGDGSSQNRMGHPAPSPDRLCLDRLRCERYAFCSFPQEDCHIEIWYCFLLNSFFLWSSLALCVRGTILCWAQRSLNIQKVVTEVTRLLGLRAKLRMTVKESHPHPKNET